MSRYPLGAPIRLSTEVRNLAGVLENAGGITLSVLKPDQTTQVYAAPTNDGAGLYHQDVPMLDIPQLGHYVYKWVSTGANSGVSSGDFDVIDPFAAEVLSLDDARAVCNLIDDSQDAELEVYIAAVTEAIEDDIGPVGRRTVTETVYPARGVLELRIKPVLSVTSITPYAGVALSSTVYTLRPGGFVYPATYAAGFYAPEYAVVYVAGRTTVQAKVNLAGREVLRHLWSFQQGPGAAQRAGFGVDNLALTSEAFSYVKSFGVQDLLKAEKLVPGSA